MIVELLASSKRSNEAVESTSNTSTTVCSIADVSTGKISSSSAQPNADYKTQAFSYFHISEVNLVYLKCENNHWLCKFRLKRFELDDVRPNSTLAVKQMFVPLVNDLALIKISYLVDAGNNAWLKFQLDNMRINLCLPYILKLYQIAMSAIGDDGSKAKSDATKKPPKKPTEKSNSPIEPPKPTTASNSSLRVNGFLRFPELILFAEPEKKDSKVLVMQTEIKLDFTSEKGLLVVFLCFHRNWVAYA
jgi:hypothetical protein